ncbi:S-layer homology domain-containing protein [Okeanomitos corallinicola TIOX110]|uniref:S-layer homology domain-containing protein n=1 Tax=Okeanomitos corallinicola TIOX110 TaxID=3133117 RepID=A0ABZ2UTB5_9CYAN
MTKASSRFKFLRYLVLCVGFVASPTSVIAQVAMLQPNELNDLPDSGLEPVEIQKLDNSDRTHPQSRELTFQFLVPDNTESTDIGTAIATKTDSEDDSFTVQSNTDRQIISKNKKSKKSNKKSKKSNKKSGQFNQKTKKFKKGKKFKKYCGQFFEGKVIKGSEFTATGNFSSATLIQVFDNEAAYLSGSSAVQTIEYSTTSNQVISSGDQIGSLTVKTTQTNKLTFQYLSTTDTNYTDIVLSNKQGYGAVTGIVDADGESYIVVSDGRRGKKCKKFKRVKQCKKGSNVFTQGNITGGGKFIETVDCSSDKLVQIFNDAPDYIFTDVRKSYWASRFIYRLSSLQIIQGFPDGDFQPETGITHAQFATIISKAFNVRRIRQATVIENISRDYWAYGNLQTAYSMGFIDVSSTTFNVEQQLTKLNVLTSIARGLGYTQVTSAKSIDEILSVFSDADSIPADDRVYIAALVEKGILVNYPNVNTLNLNQIISRAETCALVHQALVGLEKLESISSNYIAQ